MADWIEAKTVEIGKVILPLVRYGERWFVPLRFACRSVGLSYAQERRRLARLPSWWNTTLLSVEFGSPRAAQVCLPVERFESYLVAVRLGSFKPERRKTLDALLAGWAGALDGFLVVHDPIHAERSGRVDDLRANREEIEKGVMGRAFSLSAANAARGKRLSVEQFREIKDLKSQGVYNAAIARMVRCSQATVSLVVLGKYRFPPDIAGQV